MTKKQTSKKEQIAIEPVITDRQSSSFFMNEYMKYAVYTIENRALPSIIDGLKPGARKIMHAAFHMLNEKNPTNYIDLVGSTLGYSKYHHGDASLLSTISTLSSAYNDSIAPLLVDGTGGTLRSKESAAARYLGIQLSKYAKLLLKDRHILEYNFDNGVQVEPTHYLPIIPRVLTARNTGMAVGYKYASAVSYNPYDIVQQCINVLKTGSLESNLRPHIEEYGGNFVQIDNRVWAEGNWKVHRDYVDVTEFAPNETFASFENNLKALLEKGKITNWEDIKEDDDEGINYRIHFNASTLEQLVKKNQLKKLLLLGEFLMRPTYTLLNEHGKIAIFSCAEDVLKYFVDFRLGLYNKLKSVNIASFEKRISSASNIRKFIDLYVSGKIKITPKTTEADVFAMLDAHKLPHDVYDISIKKLTKEEYDKLGVHIETLQAELKYITETPVKTLYLIELESLAKEMKPEFPLQPYTIRE